MSVWGGGKEGGYVQKREETYTATFEMGDARSRKDMDEQVFHFGRRSLDSLVTASISTNDKL